MSTDPMTLDAAEKAGVPVVDYERIWLEPKCADDNPKYDEGRTWCQHDVYETCPDCGTKATEYVRADLHVSALSELDTAMAEIERLQEALEPSGDTKAAYMGEFSVRLPDVDEDGNEYTRSINVPWTTIKEIMAAIRARAALTPKGE